MKSSLRVKSYNTKLTRAKSRLRSITPIIFANNKTSQIKVSFKKLVGSNRIFTLRDRKAKLRAWNFQICSQIYPKLITTPRWTLSNRSKAVLINLWRKKVSLSRTIRQTSQRWQQTPSTVLTKLSNSQKSLRMNLQCPQLASTVPKITFRHSNLEGLWKNIIQISHRQACSTILRSTKMPNSSSTLLLCSLLITTQSWLLPLMIEALQLLENLLLSPRFRQKTITNTIKTTLQSRQRLILDQINKAAFTKLTSIV